MTKHKNTKKTLYKTIQNITKNKPYNKQWEILKTTKTNEKKTTTTKQNILKTIKKI